MYTLLLTCTLVLPCDNPDQAPYDGAAVSTDVYASCFKAYQEAKKTGRPLIVFINQPARAVPGFITAPWDRKFQGYAYGIHTDLDSLPPNTMGNNKYVLVFFVQYKDIMGRHAKGPFPPPRYSFRCLAPLVENR